MHYKLIVGFMFGSFAPVSNEFCVNWTEAEHLCLCEERKQGNASNKRIKTRRLNPRQDGGIKHASTQVCISFTSWTNSD